MIRKPSFKVCRMVGDKILPKCQTPKYTMSAAKRKEKKGGRGKSEFGTQLIEKQKIRFAYGLNERQFSNLVQIANDKGGKNVAQELWRLLESRLDNVVFRLGLASSRASARQMVSHGHILVNGRRVMIPSYSVRAGELVAVRKGSTGSPLFLAIREKQKGYTVPSWLQFDFGTLEGKVSAAPLGGDQMVQFNIPAVLEFYSRS